MSNYASSLAFWRKSKKPASGDVSQAFPKMSAFQQLPSTTDDAILDNLSAADILRFGRTCKNANQALQSYLKRKFKLSNVLSRFFTEDQTEALRVLMFETDMIISGSVALQFFDRTVYPDSDLDLYVPLKEAEAVAEWLSSVGYLYAPKSTQYPTVDIALAAARARYHPHRTGVTVSVNRGYLRAACVLDFVASDPARKIQLICSARSTVEVILGFHSTCVMNFITHDRAYCLFPRATLEERRALTYLQAEYGSDQEKATYAKYVERGWALEDSITRDEFDDPQSAVAKGPRYVGDSRCWSIPILPWPPKQESTTFITYSCAWANSFSLEYDENLRPSFQYRHVDLWGLKRQYVMRQEEADFVMNEVYPSLGYEFAHVTRTHDVHSDEDEGEAEEEGGEEEDAGEDEEVHEEDEEEEDTDTDEAGETQDHDEEEQHAGEDQNNDEVEVHNVSEEGRAEYTVVEIPDSDTEDGEEDNSGDESHGAEEMERVPDPPSEPEPIFDKIVAFYLQGRRRNEELKDLE